MLHCLSYCLDYFFFQDSLEDQPLSKYAGPVFVHVRLCRGEASDGPCCLMFHCSHTSEGAHVIPCFFYSLSSVCSRMCQNGGTRNESTCTCDCADGYSGDDCRSECTALGVTS